MKYVLVALALALTGCQNGKSVKLVKMECTSTKGEVNHASFGKKNLDYLTWNGKPYKYRNSDLKDRDESYAYFINGKELVSLIFADTTVLYKHWPDAKGAYESNDQYGWCKEVLQ